MECYYLSGSCSKNNSIMAIFCKLELLVLDVVLIGEEIKMESLLATWDLVGIDGLKIEYGYPVGLIVVGGSGRDAFRYKENPILYNEGGWKMHTGRKRESKKVPMKPSAHAL